MITLWEMEDRNDSRRILHVSGPVEGEIVVGIEPLYRKRLSSAEARAMAAALLLAADRLDASR